ncbi:MAG TPA: hypothetical protein VH370_13800 [Humisphaera sp.]|nr:hypothetical protein [Humisphaera sp.]
MPDDYGTYVVAAVAILALIAVLWFAYRDWLRDQQWHPCEGCGNLRSDRYHEHWLCPSCQAKKFHDDAW